MVLGYATPAEVLADLHMEQNRLPQPVPVLY